MLAFLADDKASRRDSVFNMLSIKQTEYRGRIQLNRDADNEALKNVFLSTDALNPDNNRDRIISVDGVFNEDPSEVSIDVIESMGLNAMKIDLQSKYTSKLPSGVKLTKDIIKPVKTANGAVITPEVATNIIDNTSENDNSDK